MRELLAALRAYLHAVLVPAFILFTPTFVFAVVDCTNGITNPSSPLTDDYVSTDGYGPCIILTNGADLDLNGHTISQVTVSYVWTIAAIRCTAPGSSITNTGANATNSMISGFFFSGTEDCEIVEGLNFGPRASDGIAPHVAIRNHGYKASSIKNNRMVAGDISLGEAVSVGIYSKLFDANARVQNNYIEATNACIAVTGTTDASGPLVENNILRNCGSGISKSDSDKMRIRKNILINRDPGALGNCFNINSTGVTFGSNICECPAECQVNPSFVLPWF